MDTADSPLEREAERVADEVMRTREPGLQRASPVGGESSEGRAENRDHGTSRTSSITSSDAEEGTVSPIVHEVLRSPRQALDAASRRSMDRRFGHDFSDVRVHTDTRAAESARSIDALAYTVDRDIVLGSGRYKPGADTGDRLLAHELTHVVQQSDALHRQPDPDAPTKPKPDQPLFTLWVDDERRRNDRRYARRLGRQDAARLLRRGRLSLALRQEINAKLRFFEGDAWQACGEEVKPALEEVLHPERALQMPLEFAADDQKRGDKKFALRIDQEDAAEIRRPGKVSGEFREGLNAKLGFFEGDAREVHVEQIKAAIDQIVASAQELRDFCTLAINDVWGAQNQGLEDFEHQLASGMNFAAIAASVLGNVIWATAAFSTGGTAFLISIAGIAVGTAGQLIPSVKDQLSFHTAAQSQIDDVKNEADGRIDIVVRSVRKHALRHGWDGNEIRHQLLRRLLKREYIKVVAGGMPVIDLPAVAASVERELLFRAATTPWKDWLGWQKGNAWLEFNYTLDDAEEGIYKPVAPSSWPPAKINWIWIFPLGNEELPDLSNRLNVLHHEVLHQPMAPQTWPIRKEIQVLIRRAGQVGITLSQHNSFRGWGTSINERYIKGWVELAGRAAASKDDFPQLLLDHLWKDSGGKPPVIEKLFLHS
jgi:hypothetical protein